MSVMWLVYFLMHAYLRLILKNFEWMIEWILISGSVIIILYQIFSLFFRYPDKVYRNFTLFLVYLILSWGVYLFVGSGLSKLIMLTAFLLSLFMIRSYPLSRNERNVLYYLLIIAIFIKIANGSSIWRRAESNRFNSNECAIALMALFCVSVVRFIYYKRIDSLVMTVLCFVLQFAFSSRGSTIGCILFFILLVLFKSGRKNFKQKTVFFVIIVVSLFGIFIAYFYVYVLFDLIGRGQFIIFGKDIFSGRQIIWKMTFESIKDNIWFGVGGYLNYDYASVNSNYMNAHNQALGMLAGFGIFQFIIFYLLLSLIVSGSGVINEKKRTRVLCAPVLFFIAISVMSYFEILYFFRGAVPMIVVAYCLLCNYKPKTLYSNKKRRSVRSVRIDG